MRTLSCCYRLLLSGDAPNLENSEKRTKVLIDPLSFGKGRTQGWKFLLLLELRSTISGYHDFRAMLVTDDNVSALRRTRASLL